MKKIYKIDGICVKEKAKVIITGAPEIGYTCPNCGKVEPDADHQFVSYDFPFVGVQPILQFPCRYCEEPTLGSRVSQAQDDKLFFICCTCHGRMLCNMGQPLTPGCFKGLPDPLKEYINSKDFKPSGTIKYQ